MNAEFNWWLLIVGLVIGGGLVALVLADWTRREADVAADELPLEATWIATVLRDEGVAIDPPTAERVLELHRAYLASPPPDGAEDPDGDHAIALEPTAGASAPRPGDTVGREDVADVADDGPPAGAARAPEPHRREASRRP